MNKELIIAHDLGTSGNKATLVDVDGNILSSNFTKYKTYYPYHGWAEQDQNEWWNSVKKSSSELIEKMPELKKKIVAVSFSGQMMSCNPVDKDGKSLYKAIIWSDVRSLKQKEYLSDLIGDDVAYKKTGTIITANYLAAKILWLKDNLFDIYKKTYMFLQAKDFIAYKLTGNFFTDYSDASGTNLFDIIKKKWDKDLVSIAKIDINKLPEPVPSTKIVGTIKKEIASQINLPSGLPVVIGGGDGPAATVGAGASTPGICYNIFGSSSWNSVTTNRPLYDKFKRIFILNHLDPKLYICIGTMQSAGASFEWLKEWIGIETYEKISSEAQNAEAGSKGLIFLPYLMGERSPYWDPEAKGVFIGLTRVTGKREIIRSVIEGVVYHLKLILDVFEENGISFDEVRLIGGGGKDKLLQKVMADVWNKKIIAMKYMNEATSLGAAIAGFIGTGIIKDFYEAEKMIKKGEEVYPDALINKRYLEYYKVFKESYKNLQNIFHELNKIIKNN